MDNVVAMLLLAGIGAASFVAAHIALHYLYTRYFPHLMDD